jgi:hypothetical protein
MAQAGERSRVDPDVEALTEPARHRSAPILVTQEANKELR